MERVCDSAEGIYTQEQLDYVASLSDESLRDILLHTIRLRDNIKRDNIIYENKINTLNNIILDTREVYPDIHILTMAEAAEKHGELDSYIKLMNDERS